MLYILMSWFVASTPFGANAESVVIQKLRTHADVVDAYCAVQTGTVYEECGAYSQETKLDIIYFPQSLGEKIASQLSSAYSKGYYRNIDRKDLFHAHPMARGPQTSYVNAAAYFQDLTALLYHSAEYLDLWKDIPDDQSPFSVHAGPERSFVGRISDFSPVVTAALDLVAPSTLLKSYKKAGTIFMEELDRNLHFTDHPLTNFDGTPEIYLNTCEAGEKDCQPCKLFQMVHIFERADGRFKAPDGKNLEIFFHCKYR